VHERDAGRFAVHPDGRHERPRGAARDDAAADRSAPVRR